MKKPTLEKVMEDLENFEYELQMYCYHKLNGRDDEAQTYLDTYLEMMNGIKEELTSVEVNLDVKDNLDETFTR